jgi:hypothetical protein
MSVERNHSRLLLFLYTAAKISFKHLTNQTNQTNQTKLRWQIGLHHLKLTQQVALGHVKDADGAAFITTKVSATRTPAP